MLTNMFLIFLIKLITVCFLCVCANLYLFLFFNYKYFLMRVHFIAIGGAAMHNLALALHNKGYQVTGSDDEIFEPSRSRLERVGILPQKFGWFPEKVNKDIDAIILGMHARIDNPELLEAEKQGLKIYSYPEYIYEQSKEKIRVVIGGSHGKTTITSMIMHVLAFHNMDFDYMVGSQLEGFDTMVRLSESAKYIILEGDEYLSSPIDLRSKFLWYKPQIALLTGIAWDHINVFPTWEGYIKQFDTFVSTINNGGYMTYFTGDKELQIIAENHKDRINVVAYDTHEYETKDGITNIKTMQGMVELEVFGEHNLQNISGAKNICNQIGISDDDFYKAIAEFKGAAKRLQTLVKTESTQMFLDFAHSPSKLEATTKAVKAQFEDRKLVACMELHTFSSLKADFLPQYKGTMDAADIAFVYFSPKTVEHKKLDPITAEDVFKAFGNPNLKVFTDSEEIVKELKAISFDKKNLLLMTSGNFGGVDLKELASELSES